MRGRTVQACFESAKMCLEKSPMFTVSRKKLAAALVGGALFSSVLAAPLWAEPAGGQDSVALQGASRRSVGVSPDRIYADLTQAVEQARHLKSASSVPRLEAAAKPVLRNLGRYPNMSRVHGQEEPLWITDRGDLTAQAVVLLSLLERVDPSPQRREELNKLAVGLQYLQRRERAEYPYGAHISWRDEGPFARLSDGSSVPTAYYQTDRAFAVQALALAGQVLQEDDFIQSAKQEAFGMSVHLLVHGDLIRSFSPQLEVSNDANDALPLIEGFWTLHKVTGERIYADLAALASHWDNTGKSLSGECWEELKAAIKASPSGKLLAARPKGKPVTFQYIEAEDGKVVNKAIDTLDYQSSSDQPGRLAVMGRENTFWMRFDVPTEDDYLFDLAYLQSDVGGGLVSVMMRIDGDKIFQVPLGDVDGKPILRRKYVDGPRPLRAGPHSFGIRFSGLLMTKPALLDSVVVQPALERRVFELPGGEYLYLLRNVTDQVARTDIDHFASWPPKEQVVVDAEGAPSKLGASEDRRRRRKFVTLPPFGVALVKVDASRAGME